MRDTGMQSEQKEYQNSEHVYVTNGSHINEMCTFAEIGI